MYESNIPCDSWCLSTWRSWTWKYHHRMASDHIASHRHRCLPTTSRSPHWRHHIRLECPAVVSKLLDTDILAYQLAHCPASSSINNCVYVNRLLQPKITPQSRSVCDVNSDEWIQYKIISTTPICQPTTSSRSTLPAKHHRPTGFMRLVRRCGILCQTTCAILVLAQKFRQHLKTFMFASN